MGNIFPKKLAHPPLVSSTAELRLSQPIANSVLLGRIYANLTEFGDLEPLPAASMPDTVRSNPSFKYLPHYRVRKPGAGPAIMLGPWTVGFTVEPDISEQHIREVIPKLVQVLDDCEVLSCIERIGLRYFNFFKDQSISGQVELVASLADTDVSNDIANIKAEIREGDFTVAVVIGNNVTVHKNAAGLGVLVSGSQFNPDVGSVLDIDVSNTNLPKKSGGEARDALEALFGEAHSLARRMFFRVLKNELIKTLGPEE